MPQKPSIPKGTRDFSPTEVARRNYIIQTLRKHFQTFGFQPIETPAFENAQTLLGKYGDEGDRLIFKILDSGEYLEKAIKKHTIIHVLNLFNGIIGKIQRELRNTADVIDGDKSKVYNKVEGYISTNVNQLINSSSQIQYLGYLESHLIGYLEMHAGELAYRIAQKRESFFRDEKGIETFKNVDLSELLSELFEEIEDYDSWSIRQHELTPLISEKALRYDLTVPFARYVVMHQNEINFPFKRYQIQPVWRADRPQKGRFREFYQCDADVVGAKSLLQEVELIQLYDAVFTDLQLHGTTIHINHRKILSGIAEVIGAKEHLVAFTVALDKLDKIGEERVKAEMRQKGITESALRNAQPLFSITGSAAEQLAALKPMLASSPTGLEGLAELEELLTTVEAMGLQSATLQLTLTLARGLNYYTGAIFEVAPPQGIHMGSLGGGGRYDDLTGIFGLDHVSGVGISFGLDRIYLVLEACDLFPQQLNTTLEVLCLNFGQQEAKAALQLVATLRKRGLRADLYPSPVKIPKQLKYADKRQVPYVLLLGEKEHSQGNVIVKNMKTGQQKTYPLNAPELLAQGLSQGTL